MNKVTIKTEYTEMIDEELTEEEAGALFKAIMEYARDGSIGGENQQLLNDAGPGARILFKVIRNDIDDQEGQS